MPSPVGHTLGAYAAMLALEPNLVKDRRTHGIAVGTAFVFGTMADADFLVAYVASSPVLHHHYFSHSIPFTIVLGLLLYLVLKLLRFKRPGRIAFLLSAAYGTHLLLDYFADDGSFPYGIPLLWPFTDRHFMAPVAIFYSIHRGEWKDLFSLHNLMGALIEFVVTGPLALLAFLRARRLQKPS